MNIEHDTEKLKESDKIIDLNDDTPLDTASVCNPDDPECEACQ